MNDQVRTCPDCGGPMHVTEHVIEEMTLTFTGNAVEAIEQMAKRRKESVEQFVFHLLWLESAKVPSARALLEHKHHDHDS